MADPNEVNPVTTNTEDTNMERDPPPNTEDGLQGIVGGQGEGLLPTQEEDGVVGGNIINSHNGQTPRMAL